MRSGRAACRNHPQSIKKARESSGCLPDDFAGFVMRIYLQGIASGSLPVCMSRPLSEDYALRIFFLMISSIMIMERAATGIRGTT